jgi:sugar phosphate isomerase/epimerase
VIFGVAGWCLDAQGRTAIEDCAALGFGAIQLGIGVEGDERQFTDSAWLAGLREEARERRVALAGIALNVLELHGTGGSDVGGLRRRALQLVRDASHAAARLGASLLYVPAFGRNRIDGESGLRQAAGFLRGACPIAAASGLTLASENTLGLADNLRLVDAVGEANFRILVDTYNPRLWGHDVPELIVGLRPWLASQAHVKDGIGQDLGCAPLGEGEGETQTALEAFAAIGYSGTFFLENDYRGPRRARASKDIEYMLAHHSRRSVRQSTAAPGGSAGLH